VARELKFCGPWNGPDFKAVFRIANLPWVVSELSNPQSLTHAAGTIWLCAFGPAMLHGCTPLH